MKLRPFIFWPHLIAAVVAGAVILIMSVTGVLLTYERQLIAWSDNHLRSAPPFPGASRLPVETLLETFRREHPDATPTAITIGSAADATAVLTVPQRTLHLDVYSGRLLGEGAQGVRRVMSELRAWHRWLAVDGDGRPVARAITGWSNVIFLFIVLSGMYLWLPRRWTWQHLRSVTLFSGRLRGKARDFNWHNVIGIWSAVPLFIVVVSAVPISFPWGNALVYRLVGEEPPAPAGRGGGTAPARAGGAAPRDAGQTPPEAARERSAPEPPQVTFAGLNDLWTKAEQQAPGWRTINLRLPASRRAPVVFAIDRGDGGQPQLRATLTLDRRTGEIVSHETFSALTLGRRIRNVMRFAHTGEVLGLAGQTVAGLVTLGSVVLVWTGIALALRRLRSWMGRRGGNADDVRDATAA
jgi:uncharacterized iron-regulated membrane protein